MTAQGDIVFTIGADVTGLTAAGRAGESSLAQIEKAARDLEREIERLKDPVYAFQKQVNTWAGANRDLAKSARDSASAFREFEKSSAQVDALRASIDPLFAASKRYEAALHQLDNALELGTISAREHAAMMDQLSAAYLRADAAGDMLATGTRGMGGGLQQVGFQLQDFVVQVNGGTSATQAFTQQFPQLASAFGPAGVAVGLFATLAIPALTAAFGNAREEAVATQDAIENLARSTQSAADQLILLQSGLGSQEQLDAIREIARLEAEKFQLQQRAAEEQGAAALYVQEQINGLQRQIDAAREKLAADKQIRAELEAARVAEQQRAAAMEAAKRIAVQFQAIQAQIAGADISSPWAALTSRIWAAVEAAKAFARSSLVYGEVGARGDPRMFGANKGQSNTFMVENYAPPVGQSGDGAGGAAPVNPLIAEIEALRQSLKTQEEIELESFTKRQQMLEQALQQRLVTQQDYASMMEQVERQHQFSMMQETNRGISQTLGALGQLFQGSKEISAGIALANSWLAFTEVLKDPAFVGRPWERVGAASSALAAGLNAVKGIQSARPGGTSAGAGRGGGAASGGVARPSAPAAPLEVMLRGLGPNDLISGAMISGLLDRLSEEAGDRGYRLLVGR